MSLGHVIEEKGSDNFSEMKKTINSLVEGTYILDIDLDFFSTRNPFLSLYEKACVYEKLAKLYQFPKNPTMEVSTVSDERRKQLQGLQSLFQHLAKHNSFDTLPEDLNKSPYLPQVC